MLPTVPAVATLLCAAIPAALALPTADNAWKAPGPNDRRSPCPMVNSLANHGFLPRNGLNVSLDDMVVAFNASVGLAEDATRLVGAQALPGSTTGNPNTVNLDDLNLHGLIEHDGSLSRGDFALGDNHSFNATIWASTAAFFTEDRISIATAAAARSARLAAAAAANPAFNLTATGLKSSLIETALYLRLFGEGTTGNARKDWVEVLFQEERLPYAEGYTRPDALVTTQELLAMANKVAAASA